MRRLMVGILAGALALGASPAMADDGPVDAGAAAAELMGVSLGSGPCLG